jgi:serine protease Do
VANSTDLRQKVAQADPGEKVDVEVRRDGKPRHVTVKLGERPRPGSEAEAAGNGGQEGTQAKLGIGVQALTPEIARQLGVEGLHGVVVASVEPGGAAEEAGLRRGDLILAINRTEVDSPADLADAVHGLSSGDRVALLVHRGDATVYVGLRVP